MYAPVNLRETQTDVLRFSYQQSIMHQVKNVIKCYEMTMKIIFCMKHTFQLHHNDRSHSEKYMANGEK